MATDDPCCIHMLRRIEQKLADLETIIGKSNPQATSPSFQIDTVNIQTLALGQLLYQLESLDVKEISGMMNIGNTTLTSPLRTRAKRTAADMQPIRHTAEADAAISIKVGGKQLSYRPIGPEPPAPGGSIHKPEWTHAAPEIEKPHPGLGHSHPALHSSFHLRDIHVGTVEDASAINLGNSFPTNFKSMKKHNQGFGNVVGNENEMQDIESMLEEKDLIETFHESQDAASHEWLAAWVAEQRKQKATENESSLNGQTGAAAED